MAENIKIAKIEHFGADELFARVRHVCMLTQRHALPYADATLELVEAPHASLRPPQRYVLVPNLTRARALAWALEARGIDLYRLDGFVRMWLDGESEPVDLLPPIVEESREADGSVVDLVCDGMHRVYAAFVAWRTPQVLRVSGVPDAYPYYAYPLRDPDWNNIEVREDLPSGYIKKWHRIPDNKRLYRDFNSAFSNVGGPRGHFVRP